MTNYFKDLLTATLTILTGCEKSYHVLHLTEKEYSKRFDCIIIICPMPSLNKTNHTKSLMDQNG